jgi:hypothetical protein
MVNLTLCLDDSPRMSYVEMSLMRSLDIDTPYDLWLANQQVLYCGHSEPSNDDELPAQRPNE